MLRNHNEKDLFDLFYTRNLFSIYSFLIQIRTDASLAINFQMKFQHVK